MRENDAGGKVLLATQSLEGEALNWWNSVFPIWTRKGIELD